MHSKKPVQYASDFSKSIFTGGFEISIILTLFTEICL